VWISPNSAPYLARQLEQQVQSCLTKFSYWGFPTGCKSVKNTCCLVLTVCLLTGGRAWPQSTGNAHAPKEELLISHVAGKKGGHLIVSEKAEPKTLNPIFALDRPSRSVLRVINADLIHINRATQRTQPALAKAWTTSKDGRRYTLHLRQGLRFSDGVPFDADDVVFSFQVYLDEKVSSPQRDLLVIGGKPISVEKLDAYTVRFELSQPYAAAERLFDSVAILPRHLLEKSYRNGTLAQAWSLNASPEQIAGLGPFRFKHYVPGERIVLERNPYYWKADGNGNRLPYLDELVFLPMASEDAEAIRFQAGDTDIISGVSAANFSVLAQHEQDRNYVLQDLGPGLEYNFLLLNLNEDTKARLPEIARKQVWFRDLRFRQAISLAIDRAGIVRLVFEGRGTPLWSNVTPGNALWADESIAQPPQSIDRARALLRDAGFSWNGDGGLRDREGKEVGFSIVASSSNSERLEMANLIRGDLQKLGMQVGVAPLEFRSMVQRVVQSHDYEAAMMGIASGDVDPNGEMNVWLSDGSTHLWNLGEKHPATPWEAEIDQLMRRQLTTLNPAERKRLYDRVQEIVAEDLPIICVATPHILVGRKQNLGNFRPGILDDYTLDNAEELFWAPK
jgi:peptide/nickel transport system substrate-binding protein